MLWLFLSLVLIAAMLALASKYLLLPAITRWFDLQDRRLAVREQQVNRPTKERDTIPLVLVMQAMQWKDEWARADALKRMQELRDETGSWDSVAAVLSQQSQH